MLHNPEGTYPPKARRIWKNLFRPDVLFFVGALQAVIPYLILADSGLYEGRRTEILYGPIIIWVLGYLSFWIGARLVPRKKLDPRFRPIAISLATMKLVLLGCSLLCVVELYGAAKVYGGLPILAFMSGTRDVADSNLAEAQSGFGQIGLLLLTLILMTALVVMLIIKARQRQKPVALWCCSALLLILFGDIINGKRQGVLLTLMLIACCSTCAFGSPWSAFESLFPWKMTRRRRFALAAVGCLTVFQFIGGIGSIRSTGNQNLSSVDTLLLYYGYPVMNIEEECRAANGLGPMEFKPLGIVYSLLPAKSSLRDSSLFGTDPPRVEITSPSGFYERILWDTGPAGVVLFSLCCGAFSMYVYQRAFHNYSALLAYGLIAWALFSAPLYNHFLNLLFLPLPAILFWGIPVTVRLLIKASRPKQLPLYGIQ